VAHGCTQEAKAGRLKVQGQPGLHNEILSKTKTKTKKTYIKKKKRYIPGGRPW
jgi:hypothetical protein